MSRTFKDILESMECVLNLAKQNKNASEYKEQLITYELFLEMLTEKIDKLFGSDKA